MADTNNLLTDMANVHRKVEMDTEKINRQLRKIDDYFIILVFEKKKL